MLRSPKNIKKMLKKTATVKDNQKCLDMEYKMGFTWLKRLEKAVVIALVCMLAISAVLIWAWLRPAARQKEAPAEVTQPGPAAVTGKSAVLGGTDLLPENCTLNQNVSELSFEKENGESFSIGQLGGKALVLEFWASWCPDCREELEKAGEIKALLAEYKDVEYLLVDRLDSQRETREQVLAYLKESSIPFVPVFDNESAVYKKLGIRVIPTTLVVDPKGVLRAWHAGSGMDVDILRSMLDYAFKGGAYGTLNFIEKELTNEEGGINTNYMQGEPSGLSNTDVLSESQGLLMEYAALAGNRTLFEQSYQYLTAKMRKDPLTAWVVTDSGPSRVNSALDDLRIYRSLVRANELWSGYDGQLDDYGKLLWRYNTDRQNLVNQYDFKYRKKSDRLKLCFADFEALKELAIRDHAWEKVYGNALSIVEKGYIRDNFPLYYSEYDYKKKAYRQEDINMAEEMLTLLHLAKQGKLRSETLVWLKSSVEGDGIFAKYTAGGKVAEGYWYESTAIYGLAAMIARLSGDRPLADKALAKMEAMRVFDSSKKTDGAFGNPDGTGIYSFDQCIALLTYGIFEESDGNGAEKQQQ